MAFNRNDPSDLATLKAEVETDPLGMGYPLNNVTQIIKLINDPDDNLGNETVAETLTVAMLLDVVDMADFDGPQVSDGERRFIESFLNRDLNEDIDRWKDKIRSAFQVNSGTSNAIAALVRRVSRAEVLFDDGTSLVREDWYAARDS